MKKYVYALAGAPDWAVAKRPMIEFEALNIEEAWKHAEKNYGSGGQLYEEVPRPTTATHGK